MSEQQRNSQQYHVVNILLVEDNPDHALLTKHALSAEYPQARVMVASDGQEALDYLFGKGDSCDTGAAPRPGLILLDIRMPKLDGITVLHKIKSHPRLQSIPVCMLTTSSDPNDIERSYAAGAELYITKPLRFGKRGAKLRQLASLLFPDQELNLASHTKAVEEVTST